MNLVRLNFLVIAAAAASATGAGAQSVPGVDNINWNQQNVTFTADALRAYNDVSTRWSAAWMEGDAKKVSELYSVGAVVAFTGDEMVRGRDGVFRLLSARMPRGLDVRLSPTDVVSSGDVMTATGPFVVETSQGIISGTYSMTLRLEQNRWRIRSQVFTPSLPLVEPAAADTAAETAGD